LCSWHLQDYDRDQKKSEKEKNLNAKEGIMHDDCITTQVTFGRNFIFFPLLGYLCLHYRTATDPRLPFCPEFEGAWHRHPPPRPQLEAETEPSEQRQRCERALGQQTQRFKC